MRGESNEEQGANLKEKKSVLLGRDKDRRSAGELIDMVGEDSMMCSAMREVSDEQASK